MDTDSIFYCSSELFIEQCVLPHRQDHFFNDYERWMVPKYCPLHKDLWVKSMTDNMLFVQPRCCYEAEIFHGKTLGLFKEEAFLRKIIILNAKSYFGEGWYDQHRNEIDKFIKDGDIKFSSKGMSKTTNSLTFERYCNVLVTKGRDCGINRGFKSTLEGGMFTYKLNKYGLNYLFAKRHVCDDGITTEPLNK
jgi:hypothetical protein